MAEGLSLRNLVVRKGAEELVRIDAHVAAGSVLTLMGPSGAGKSSLLSAIIGALPSGLTSDGEVWLNSKNITGLAPERRRIGLLFQDDLLFPHMSVAGNLAFGLAAGGSRTERAAKIAEALEQVGLAGFGDRDPATLSGGQRARVALMRTLLSQPRALLLDEPFSRLDSGLKDQTRQLVFGLIRSKGLPTVLVTHDPQDAKAAGGTVIDLGQK